MGAQAGVGVGSEMHAIPPWESLDESEEYDQMARARLKHMVPVREPLALISQVQRSGGTLLNQLFDGHPECHVHPPELKIGHPDKRTWPPLDLDSPDRWFELLFSKAPALHLRRGHRPGRGDVFPLIFFPRLQKLIFDRCIERSPVERERDVLDCYMTSYFNAWLDNHNLYTGPKKVVVGFAPGLAMDIRNVERFFAAYPDGKLISSIRDPAGWYASALQWSKRYRELEWAMGLWRQSAEAVIEARERWPERVIVLTYEELVQQTEATMSRIAARIGISMSPSLLVPTFNNRPIRANSSESVERYGVLTERAAAYRDLLDASTLDRIIGLEAGLYERVAGSPRPCVD